MLITCTCGEEYDTSDYPDCPKCGYDNQNQLDEVSEDDE